MVTMAITSNTRRTLLIIIGFVLFIFAFAGLVLPTSVYAEEDLWGDVDGGNVSQAATSDSQQGTAQSGFAEPPIQMWSINKATDRYRQRPPAGTFKDFRQGSIDFWVKFDPSWEASSDSGTLVALSNGYDTLFEFSMSAEGDAIFMANAEDDAINGERSRRNAVPFDFTDGLIHHVALVTNNDLTKMYVDGTAVGEFSLGYAIPEDAQGQRQDLQLSIGSLDGIANKFKGQIGALRIWGVPLDGRLLLKAAFMRDKQLMRQAWAKSFLIAHMENNENQSAKPRLNMLPSFFRPEGVWMSPKDKRRTLVDRRVQTQQLDVDGLSLDLAFRSQVYTQLILTDRNSDLGRFAKASQGVTRTLTSAIDNKRSTSKQPIKKAVPKVRQQSSFVPAGFTKKANKTIHGQKLAIRRVGIEQCAKMCRDNSQCVAFTFEPKKFDCSLTANTSMVVNNPNRDAYFITRAASQQPSAPGEVLGYTKLPGKFVLGRLVKVTKTDLATCAQTCSNESQCIEFSYNSQSTECFLIASRNGLATVNNTSTYTKAAGSSQQVAAEQKTPEPPAPQKQAAVQPQATALKSPLAVQKPAQPITNKDLPVIVRLTFNPYQADKAKGTPEQVYVEAFEPAGQRNRYQSVKNKHALVVTSATRMYEYEPRFSQSRVSLQAKPKKTDANVRDVFIVGNQLRSKGSILSGFDPINLDPFDFAKASGGTKAQIFEHSQYGFNSGANRVVPLGLELVDSQSGEGRVKSKEVTTEAQMQNMLGGNVSVTAEVDTVKGGATFSGNANFKSTTSNMNSGKSAYTFAQEHHVRYVLLIDKAKMGLTSNFRDAVLLAAQRPSQTAAMQLVQEFGTHYAQSAAMGGRIIQLTELDSKAWGAAQTYEGGVGAAVEARIGPQGVMGGKVGAEGSVQASEMQSFNNQVSDSVESWQYSGGAGRKDSWQVTEDTVAPIFLDLRPINEILAPPFFTDPKVFDTLRPMVYRAVKQYVQKNARNIATNSRFVPARIAKPVTKLANNKSCAADISSFRSFINTDSRKEGGGAWARVRLPAAEHTTTKSMVAGCQAHSHGDGWQDLAIEVNSVCWKAATFQCKNGKWEHTFGWSSSKIFTRSKTGVTTTDSNAQQEILESGTGNKPW